MRRFRDFARGAGRIVVLGLTAFALAAGQAFADPPEKPEDAWRKAAPLLEKVERESLAAVGEQVKAVDQVFDEARKGAYPFAEDILGMQGKAIYAYSASGAERV